MKPGEGLHVLRGGEGDALLVLLHGMGANAEVWQPMLQTVGQHWRGRWIAPDLRGHGRSVKGGALGARVFALDVATVIANDGAKDVIVVGHSFGGLIAAIVGSNEFGATISRVAAFGVKLEWTDEDVERMYALSRRPPQDFDTYDAAAERALAFAGLKGLADVHSPVARAGVEEDGGRFRLSLNLRVFGSTGKEVASSMRVCRVPLRMASGERDTMAPIAPMRALDPQVVAIPGAGHNAHWEAPEKVWDFVLRG